jgi:hypothetical protein
MCAPILFDRTSEFSVACFALGHHFNNFTGEITAENQAVVSGLLGGTTLEH